MPLRLMGGMFTLRYDVGLGPADNSVELERYWFGRWLIGGI